MQKEELIQAFRELGFDEFKEIKMEDIIFSGDVFDQCARNTCGNYGKNHACPPGAGTLEERKSVILQYNKAFLLNKILSICSMEEMEESQKTLESMRREFEKRFHNKDVMYLGAGPCKLCKTCTALENEPCRFPDKTQYSMEGSGIDVVSMSLKQKMTYNAGSGKVGFFSLVLYKE